MFYQVLSPFVTTVEADSIKDAIKNFVKINYAYQINNLIIADQQHRYRANINYMKNPKKAHITYNRTNWSNNGMDAYPPNSAMPIFQENMYNHTITQPVGIVPTIIQNTENNDSKKINVVPIISAPNMISTIGAIPNNSNPNMMFNYGINGVF